MARLTIVCADRRGFTLIELVLVLGLIAVILAVATPQLMPVLALSTLEGNARHLANYGRGAMAHATLMHERLTIKVDLDKQEYWTVRWLEEEDDGLFEEEEQTDEEYAQEKAQDFLFGGEDGEMDARAQEMQERFDRFAMMSLQSQARNVRHEGLFDETGPLFEKEFDLDEGKEDDSDYEEMKQSLLVRTKMTGGVVIEDIRLGATIRTKGVVDIEVTPTGLAEFVAFRLKSGEEDYFTVSWDPITGGAKLYEGREDYGDIEESSDKKGAT